MHVKTYTQTIPWLIPSRSSVCVHSCCSQAAPIVNYTPYFWSRIVSLPVEKSHK